MLSVPWCDRTLGRRKAQRKFLEREIYLHFFKTVALIMFLFPGNELPWVESVWFGRSTALGQDTLNYPRIPVPIIGLQHETGLKHLYNQ